MLFEPHGMQNMYFTTIGGSRVPQVTIHANQLYYRYILSVIATLLRNIQTYRNLRIQSLSGYGPWRRE